MPVMSKIPKTIAAGGISTAKTWGQDNAKWLQQVIKKHNAWIRESKVEKYQELYDGYIESVDTRDKERGDGINNKIMANYSQIIIDTIVDYMLGKAITWTVEDPEAEPNKESDLVKQFRHDFLAVMNTEEARRVLIEQLRQGSIATYSGVICWVNEKSEIEFDEYPVQEFIPVYNSRGRLKMVLRYYKSEYLEEDNTKEETFLEVYDEMYVTYYKSAGTGEAFELNEDEEASGNPYRHYAQRIPVSIFINGTPARYEERQQKVGVSDLGNGVVSVLEDYAHKISDKSNLAEYLMDQYLLLIGVDTDQGEVIKMRKARALVLKGDKNVTDARFMSQDQDDQAIENLLKRLKETIYETTFTPRLSDLQGATATEIKMKYADLDIKAGKKETYFAVALKQLITVVVDLLNAKKATGEKQEVSDLDEDFEPQDNDQMYRPEWVAVTLNRNLPQNFKELAEIVTMLSGIAPDNYLYELLWFIEDPKQALEEIKAQKEAEAKQGLKAMGFDSGFTDVNKEDPTED